jgi:hypothetical protein
MKSFFIAFVMLCSYHCFAQQLVCSTGNTLSSNTLTVEYTVGEIAIETLTGNQQTITQGLLQPNYALPTANNELFEAQYALNYYPNPVGPTLHIETTFKGFRKVKVYTLDGKCILQQAFDAPDISLKTLPVGNYLLTLSDEQNLYFKTIKIIKI